MDLPVSETMYGSLVRKRQGFSLMTRSIGYARCSTTQQDTDAQFTELRSAGCQEVFAEKVSIPRTPGETTPVAPMPGVAAGGG